MDPGLLYAFFGTISGTLATAFALLAAIVLYRFQSLDTGLPNALDGLANAIGDGTPKIELLRKLQHRGDVERFVELFKERVTVRTGRSTVEDAVGSLGTTISAQYEYLCSLVRTKRQLRRRLLRSLLLTVCTIVFCVGAIPFSDLVSNCVCLAVILIAAGFALFLACLSQYVWLIWGMFAEARPPAETQ